MLRYGRCAPETEIRHGRMPNSHLSPTTEEGSRMTIRAGMTQAHTRVPQMRMPWQPRTG